MRVRVDAVSTVYPPRRPPSWPRPRTARSGELGRHVAVSLARGESGFVLGAAAGTGLGVLPGSLAIVLKVFLPPVLPTILQGYRVGSGIALPLVVSAEMVDATSGIGFLILDSGDLILTGKLMVGLAVLSLLGLASTSGIRALEARLAPRNEEGGAADRPALRARSSPCASLR